MTENIVFDWPSLNNNVLCAQQALAARDVNVTYVDSSGADTAPVFPGHFSSAGTLDIGSRLAQAYLEEGALSPVVNGSFECPFRNEGGYQLDVPQDDWDGAHIFNPHTNLAAYSSSTPPGMDGRNCGYLYNFPGEDDRDRTRMAQLTPTQFQPGFDYRVTIACGNRNEGSEEWPGYRVQFIAGLGGPNEVALVDSGDVASHPAAPGEFAEVSFDYSAGSVIADIGEPLTVVIEMAEPDEVGFSDYLDVDNVRLVASSPLVPISTPSSLVLALLLLDTAALLVGSRRDTHSLSVDRAPTDT